MHDRDSRRAFLTLATTGALLTACESAQRLPAAPGPSAPLPPPPLVREVDAFEDLMHEHGIIRRILVVYREAALRLRTKPSTVPPEMVQKAAQLLRTFGEDFHERALEERLLFPALTKAGGAAARDVETLRAQHERGRELTVYVLVTTQKAIGTGALEPLARCLEGFARMYEAHAAQEDTSIFPAWKKLLTPEQLADISDRFADVEHATFGRDGFKDAVAQIAAVEKGLAIDLTSMTAPPAP
jgi:hemerythrin-like domain-containing protein